MLYNMPYVMLHMIFAENLSHFKLDQPEYSKAPGDYGKLPLFHDNKSHKTFLDEFVFYVFPKVSSRQSMRDIHATALDELTELLLHLRYAELLLSRSGPAMPEVPVVSRNMIAYLISLLSAAPFYRKLDPRVISRTDKFFAICLATMANSSDKDLRAYVHSKATGYYRRFPPVGSPDRADEKVLRPRVKEGAEGRQEGSEAKVVAERAVKMSDDDTDATP